jgi:hypothetical protein
MITVVMNPLSAPARASSFTPRVSPSFCWRFFPRPNPIKLRAKMLQQKEGETLGVKELALAGALSGFMTTVIMAPGERIKCILQVIQVLFLLLLLLLLCRLLMLLLLLLNSASIILVR